MTSFNFDDFLNEPFPLFPEPLPTPVEDIVQLSQRLEQLTVEVNTMNIKLELETIKRQRLRKSLKQSNAEILALKHELTQQNHDNITLREQMVMLSQTVFSEIVCLTQHTHLCLGRIHHMMITTVPRIPMTEAEHSDLSQQAVELLRALQLIRVVLHHE